MLFGAQALVNLAVAMAMLPTKGLTLPFVSYGGSSLLVSAAAMGILLNISRSRESASERPRRRRSRARSERGGGHRGELHARARREGRPA